MEGAPGPAATGGQRIYTLGHSSRTEEELLRILRARGIRYVVDVRRFPGSRRSPQFSREHLEQLLARHQLIYLGMGRKLGGFRKEGYETHLASDTFRQGIGELEETARKGPAAILCAEALWFRCHRRLIADELARRGWEVVHILSEERDMAHPRPRSDEAEPPP